MPDIPDFTLKPTFPIASVIDAAQRKAQIEQENQRYGQQSLVQGLQSIGQIGDSLVARRQKVARSLALGRQFDIPDDVAKTMEPDDVLKVGAIKKGYISADSFLGGLHAQLTGNNPVMPASGTANPQPTGATPAAGATTQPSNGVILASGATTSPMPETPAPAAVGAPATPATTPVPVPIPAPPAKPRMLNPAEQKFLQHTVDAINKNKPENVYTNDNGKLNFTAQVPKGSKVLPSQSNVDTKEQDKLEQQARQGLQSVRGDTSIKNVEAQRDAAITAFNRLKQIEFSGKPPNPVDYVDILGQVYKARTGTAPTDAVLRDARQQTAEGQFGKVYTFFTGNQAPATSKAIAASLKDMVVHMGLQADELHDGYMQVHGAEIFPTGLAPDRAARLAKVARGKSFTDATGVKPEDYDPHIQAIKWAQDNPNDPRSAPILQKAMQAKQGVGGTIGL